MGGGPRILEWRRREMEEMEASKRRVEPFRFFAFFLNSLNRCFSVSDIPRCNFSSNIILLRFYLAAPSQRACLHRHSHDIMRANLLLF